MRGLLTLLLGGLLTPGNGLAQGLDPEAIKARLFATPDGTEIRVTLTNDEVVTGAVSELRDSGFGLRVEDPDKRFGARFYRRQVPYETVSELDIPESDAGLPTQALVENLRPGDRLTIRTSAGGRYQGKLKALDENVMQIDDQSVRMADEGVMRIEVTRNDSMVNGLAIGVGIAAGFSFLECMAVGCIAENAVGYFAVFGGLGAAIDYSHKKNLRLIALAPGEGGHRLAVSPVIVPGGAGVGVSFRF